MEEIDQKEVKKWEEMKDELNKEFSIKIVSNVSKSNKSLRSQVKTNRSMTSDAKSSSPAPEGAFPARFDEQGLSFFATI